MKILGIDESGRGPVIGPLIMCGFMIDEKDKSKLKELGVKDSKLLKPEKREELAKELEKISKDHVLIKVSAKEVDKAKNDSNINQLEIEKMQEIINVLQADKVVIDSPEVNTARFSEKVMLGIKKKKLEIVSENYADKNHPEVSAASILAKSLREKEIEKLKKKHGDFGTGYPSDERTIRFLKDWIKKNKEFPDFVRKSWITAQLMIKEKSQLKLSDWNGRK